MFYLIRTEGCQMNAADSLRVAAALEELGYRPTKDTQQADVIVLNTCVVRQSAEDKAFAWLSALRPLKRRRPHLVINLMGCLVGIRGAAELRAALPYVDVFSPPSEPGPLLRFLAEREERDLAAAEAARRFEWPDETSTVIRPAAGPWRLPPSQAGRLVTAFIPVVYGCSHACSFCVIPCRRGSERSRRPEEIVAEIRSLAEQGIREVTLLGQIVDRYGKDLGGGIGLAQLLRAVSAVAGLERIRFLTSHPAYLTDELLETAAALPKVCEHIEVPVQAGDDEVLSRMRRGYTADDYCRLVERIRRLVPAAAIATDVIVGFPGETEAQFRRTYDLLADLKLDVVHLARYSPRPQTLAARTMPDDVPAAEKERRFRLLEDLQARIAADINARLLNQTVEVLVEDLHNGKWRGRTRTNKLIFFTDPADWRGRPAQVTITHTGPWSLQGRVVG